MVGAGGVAGGISSRRGLAVTAVGLSLTRRVSASSDFLPMAVKRCTAAAATATSDSTSKPMASRPLRDSAIGRRSATLGMPGSPGSGAMVFGSWPAAAWPLGFCSFMGLLLEGCAAAG